MIRLAVFLNGDLLNLPQVKEYLNRADFIIGVDGGLNHLASLNISPHIFLGDFDSVQPEILDSFLKSGIKHNRFLKNKDFTDSEAAVLYCLNHAQEIRKIANIPPSDKTDKKPFLMFFAAFGKRYDHLLSNQFLAQKYAASFDFLLTDGRHFQFILQNQNDNCREYTLNFSDFPFFDLHNPTFSILAMSEKVEEVSIFNAVYPLKETTLYRGQSIGISNLPLRDRHNQVKNPKITFKKGCLSIFVLPEI